MNTVFRADEIVTVTGFQQDCECSHCGRALKVGVRLEGFSGSFGADCLAKSFAPYAYGGKKYAHSSAEIRERGIIAGKGQKCIERHGMSAHHFRFALKSELRSI